MRRIPPVDRNTTNDSVRKNFDAVQKQLGTVPNMMRTMAQSPAVLEGYLGFGAALRRGRLPAALQEQIAADVAPIKKEYRVHTDNEEANAAVSDYLKDRIDEVVATAASERSDANKALRVELSQHFGERFTP